MNWLYIKHSETGGTADVPDEPGVEEWYAARGWEVTERPEEKPYVPPADGGQAVSVDGFVTLAHPETHATHDFPDNEAAVEGARDAGWRYPEELKRKAPSKPKTKSDAESVTDNSESEKS